MMRLTSRRTGVFTPSSPRSGNDPVLHVFRRRNDFVGGRCLRPNEKRNVLSRKNDSLVVSLARLIIVDSDPTLNKQHFFVLKFYKRVLNENSLIKKKLKTIWLVNHDNEMTLEYRDISLSPNFSFNKLNVSQTEHIFLESTHCLKQYRLIFPRNNRYLS